MQGVEGERLGSDEVSAHVESYYSYADGLHPQMREVEMGRRASGLQMPVRLNPESAEIGDF